jgi:hypothetical protein
MNGITDYIESVEFANRANLANDFRTFIRALSLDDARNRLFETARGAGAAETLLDRVRRLCSAQSSIEFENPYDAALAAYMHVLYYVDPTVAFEAARTVSDAPRLWWAEFVARTILRASELRTLVHGDAEAVNVSSDAVETLQRTTPENIAAFWRLGERPPLMIVAGN